MKRWLSLAISILALAVAPTTALAGQDSVHFGPISSGTPDSGTCRPVWANDTYMRVFDAAPMSTVPRRLTGVQYPGTYFLVKFECA